MLSLCARSSTGLFSGVRLDSEKLGACFPPTFQRQLPSAAAEGERCRLQTQAVLQGKLITVFVPDGHRDCFHT